MDCGTLFALDKTNAKPLHIQIEESILQKLESKEWAPGKLIPSENELSHIYGVSRTTVRNVITKLVQELEERNLLVKQADEKDKRVINLTLTEEGKEFVELRVTHFHGEWASRLPDLDDAVVDEFVHAITRMQETMPGIKGVKNNGKRK